MEILQRELVYLWYYFSVQLAPLSEEPLEKREGYRFVFFLWHCPVGTVLEICPC